MAVFNYDEAQSRLQLLNKARNNLFYDILEKVLDLAKAVQVSVTVSNEYDDNSYYMEVAYSLDGFSFYDLEDSQNSSDNESEEESEVVHQALRKNGTTFSEVENLLNLIPSSFWEENYGEVDDLKINTSLLNELRKKG